MRQRWPRAPWWWCCAAGKAGLAPLQYRQCSMPAGKPMHAPVVAQAQVGNENDALRVLLACKGVQVTLSFALPKEAVQSSRGVSSHRKMQLTHP